MKIYGVINSTTCEFIDVSTTERGAKWKASRDGYTQIGYRDSMSYYPRLTHVKQGRRWVEVMHETIFN
jgi:hypothetical protein